MSSAKKKAVRGRRAGVLQDAYLAAVCNGFGTGLPDFFVRVRGLPLCPTLPRKGGGSLTSVLTSLCVRRHLTLRLRLSLALGQGRTGGRVPSPLAGES